MAIIVEDGTGSNPAANSYQDLDDLKDYAALRDVDLSSYDDVVLEAVLHKAMDFLESHKNKYKGQIVNDSQPLRWPRSGVPDPDLPSTTISETTIPHGVRYGQLTLAIEALTQDLQPNASLTGQGAVVKEKVGNIEIQYSSNQPKQHYTSAFSKSMGLLSPYLIKSGLRVLK